jgi:L-alanine-DL-glutamate epimerase-like enolase superfamily enzyme
VTIVRIDVSQHDLPLDPPFPAAWDPRPRETFSVTIVRVTDDTGAQGFGSGGPMRDLTDFAGLFLGRDPLDLPRHHEVVANASFHAGRMWPLEVALWDLAGKLRGVPLWQMVGGRSERVAAYASTGVHRQPAAAVETALEVRGRGFPAMKLRLGRPRLEDDLDVVAAVCDAVAGDMKVLVDCNQAWRMPWDTARPWTVEHAIDVAQRLADLGVYWMEEPLHRGDVAGMRRLRESAGLLIAGGEMTREIHELEALLANGCLDVFQPDATLTGGVEGLRRLAAGVEAAGCAFTPHTWGDGLAVMANLHLAAGASSPPFVEYPLDPPEWSLDRRDFVLVAPIEVDAEAWITMPDAPGLGVDLDEERLEATLVSHVAFTRDT